MPKLQIVADDVITDCLKRLPGRTKTDKIRWALCVYRALLTMPKHGDRDGIRDGILTRAGHIYRQDTGGGPTTHG